MWPVNEQAMKSRPSSQRCRREARERSGLRTGFTLIEMLVVIAVIAILASMVGPMVFRNVGDAKVASARSQIEILATALEAYRLDNDWFPTSAQGLTALWQAPSGQDQPLNWRGPYLRKPPPVDPWGRPYVYVSPGTVNPMMFDLLTYGRDGAPGGTDEDADITSWENVP